MQYVKLDGGEKMSSLRIQGGRRLDGEWTVGCAKNAVLPIMAAAILADDSTTLLDCPNLSDVRYMGEILRALGCQVTERGHEMRIDPQGISSFEMPDDLAKRIRSSIFMLGPLLSRFRKATVTFPGGCEIGMRPIDLHLAGLRQLGVQVREEGGMIYCDGSAMRCGSVHFDYPSVGATENAMMAAVTLRGKTCLHNVAREPEIMDLQYFINAMGGKVSGRAQHHLRGGGQQAVRGRVPAHAGPDRGGHAAGGCGHHRRVYQAEQRPMQGYAGHFQQAPGDGLRGGGERHRGDPQRSQAPEGLCPAPDPAAPGLPHGYAGTNAHFGHFGKGNFHRGGECV